MYPYFNVILQLGKLDVEIEVYRPFPAAEISPFTPSIGDGLASHNQHFIGQTIRCRVRHL